MVAQREDERLRPRKDVSQPAGPRQATPSQGPAKSVVDDRRSQIGREERRGREVLGHIAEPVN